MENSDTLHTWTAVERIALGCRYVGCENLHMSIHVLYIRVYGKLSHPAYLGAVDHIALGCRYVVVYINSVYAYGKFRHPTIFAYIEICMYFFLTP